MWSRSARDWRQPAEKIIQRLRRVQGGDIVLLHDGDHRVPEGDRRHTVAALAYWLPRWKDAGIRFVSLDEVAQAGSGARAGKDQIGPNGRKAILRRERRDQADAADVSALPPGRHVSRALDRADQEGPSAGRRNEQDRQQFAKARSYMVRVDNMVACRNIRCRKRFDLTGQTVFLI